MLNKPLILVTGATGKTGGAVARQLREQGVRVRAMVRVRDSRSAALEIQGVEVVIADAFDPAGVDAAMQGVRSSYEYMNHPPR